MTFHNQNNKRIKDQAGVTLLLAILMLAAITTIVFSIAAIAINEIRTSADVSRTAPSITGAEAVAEEYMYVGVRGVGALPQCSASTTEVRTLANGVKVSSCATYYLSNPYEFSLSENQQADLYLINPSDQSLDPGYTYIQVDMQSQGPAYVLEIYLCLLSTENCGTNYVESVTLNSVAGWRWSKALDPSEKYIVLIANTGEEGNVRVTTAPVGLPSGFTVVENTGTYQGTTRKLRTTFPQ